MKNCYKCHTKKQDSSFNKRQYICKDCQKIVNKEYKAANKEKIKQQKIKYNLENKDKIADYKKIFNLNNKDKIRKQRQQFYKNNKEMLKARVSKHYIENKSLYREYNTKYFRDRRLNDSSFKLRGYFSTSIRRALQCKNRVSCLKFLSYSFQELKIHLETQFESWMTWENYGTYKFKIWDDNDQTTWTWQVDHIIPHSTFEYTSMEDQEFRDCWALSNLRPLSSKQNFLDGVRKVRH